MNLGYLYAFLTALCWSTSGLFVKYIHQSAVVIAGGTAFIAFLFNRIFMKQTIHLTPFVAITGVVQFLMNLTFIFANQMTSVGNAIVLQYSSMVFVLIYESIDQRKLPYLYQIIVIVMAAIGMMIFFFDSFSFQSMLGNLLAVVSGAFFGLQFYLNTKKQAEPRSSLQIQYICSIAAMLVYVLSHKGIAFAPKDVIFIVMSGIFQTALAGIFFTLCIIRIPAFTANVICMSEIVLAPMWAFIFLKESFTFFSMIGACMMIFALLMNVYMEYQMKQP